MLNAVLAFPFGHDFIRMEFLFSRTICCDLADIFASSAIVEDFLKTMIDRGVNEKALFEMDDYYETVKAFLEINK